MEKLGDFRTEFGRAAVFLRFGLNHMNNLGPY